MEKNVNPTISKIRIYPIKSLGPVEVSTAAIGTHALSGDRLFAMVDKNGRYVNGKRTPKVNLLSTDFDLDHSQVTITNKINGEQNTFDLKEGNTQLDTYLSDFFELPINLIKNEQGQFMDIPIESSVTIVSESSLTYLQQKMEAYSLENLRLRFRTNLEVSGVPPFWEEQLFQQRGVGIRFKIGEVEMIGVSPRARCNVPPQNPQNGEMDYYFVKNMLTTRNELLPQHNYLSEFGRSSYFLTLNTFIPKSEHGKTLNLNDKIRILAPEQLPYRNYY